jgi:hypothetical protein
MNFFPKKDDFTECRGRVSDRFLDVEPEALVHMFRALIATPS